MEDALHQTFTVERSAHDVLDDAAQYLEGAGVIAPKLRGTLERYGDALAIHHGRIETRITAQEAPGGTRVDVTRHGQAPLEETRRWILGLGLGGFLLAWAVTFYNEAQGGALHPLWTITLFLVGLVATVAVLYVADKSLESRSEGLILSLEDAVRGKPEIVLHREIDALERSSALANGFLFYCGSLLVAFFVYAIVFSDGVRAAIDAEAALTTMRFVFLFPIVPAALFSWAYFAYQNKVHRERMALLDS